MREVNAPVIGVLGGGQLGRMLALAGLPLGVAFRFLDPSPDATAGALGPLFTGPFDDDELVDRFATGATVVTYEWEGVPASTARRAAKSAPVLPGDRPLEVSQDRVVEKTMLRSLGIGTAAFVAVDDRADLDRAVGDLGLPAVLKTRVGGYDGKGQALLRDKADVDPAWTRLGSEPLILEAFVPFTRELSVIGVRSATARFRCYPVVENRHDDGILRVSRAPAPGADENLQQRAEACIRPLLDALDYVGVACVELFDTGDGLLANEWAPRVHNSGHWTIEGAVTSQFENHVRAVLGWPLGDVAPVGVSAMVNCIGAMPDPRRVLEIDGAHLHDYGKPGRPGRKVGHVTVTAPNSSVLGERLTRVHAAVAGA
ncbi:MAG: 5-(carboxyamino)imidazole ribonucleotide synthase [Actinomycetota bacterium]|nr:5-(carboxyamino)imidazole ribonucleotide synthase [Actinomycetota bacterium]